MPLTTPEEITLGFEVECDTTRTNNETFLVIKITHQNGEISYLTPDEYLKSYDKSSDHLENMYDVLVFECHELDREGKKMPGPSIIDGVFDSAVTDAEGRKRYLTEFRIEPIIAGSMHGHQKIGDLLRIIDHHVHFIKTSPGDSVAMSDWSRAISAKTQAEPHWLSTQYDFDTQTIEPKVPYTADIVLKTPALSEFEPVLAIHVNVALPLRALFSKQTWSAFPPETNYPKKTSEALEWPSCKIPPEHIAFAHRFIAEIEDEVDYYIRSQVSAEHASPLELQNIAGVLRTLIYCYGMQLYIESDLCKRHFPPSIYTHEYGKDFYLFGLPKFDLGLLVDKLSDREQSLLHTHFFPKPVRSSRTLYPVHSQDMAGITSLFTKCIGDLYSKETLQVRFSDPQNDRMVFYSMTTYINATLINPLLNRPRRHLSLVAKVLDPLVMEFRAASGHGCSIAELPMVLKRHTGAAYSLGLSAPATDGLALSAVASEPAKGSKRPGETDLGEGRKVARTQFRKTPVKPIPETPQDPQMLADAQLLADLSLHTTWLPHSDYVGTSFSAKLPPIIRGNTEIADRNEGTRIPRRKPRTPPQFDLKTRKDALLLAELSLNTTWQPDSDAESTVSASTSATPSVYASSHSLTLFQPAQHAFPAPPPIEDEQPGSAFHLGCSLL